MIAGFSVNRHGYHAVMNDPDRRRRLDEVADTDATTILDGR
jgi:hypothetical protein